MALPRDELRDHLVAALEAAPELPRDNREYLADVFLDELDARYKLVPRSRHVNLQTDVDAALSGLVQAGRRWWPAIAAAFALLVVVPSLAWLAAAGFATHAHGHHPFGFAPFLIFLFLARFLGPWRYRRRRRVML